MKRSPSCRGFTLIELIITLAILGIMAAMAVSGLTAYTRLAAFGQNESNAKTMFLAAQTGLTHKDVSGGLSAWLGTDATTRATSVKNAAGAEHGYFTGTEGETGTDAATLNERIYAIFLDKGEYARGEGNRSPDGQLVADLLEDYTYDKSILNAAICLEIDLSSGQVYSVFYTGKSDSLSFRGGTADREGGATSLADRGYAARRSKTLVGYYSAGDVVNRVNLTQIRLKLSQKQLVNGETLYLNWSSNSRHQSMDVVYKATFYQAADTGAQQPLFDVTVDLYRLQTDCDYKSGSVLAALPVTIYRDNGDTPGSRQEDTFWFPLTCTGGAFTLTLDAMLDAQLLYDCQRSASAAALAKSSFYSITRLLDHPENIYAVITASPNQNRDPAITEEYTASRAEEGKTNVANTLFADGSAPQPGNATAYQAGIAQYRHLYNVRFLQSGAGGTRPYATVQYTLAGGTLNWLNGSMLANNDKSAVTVYRAPEGVRAGGDIAARLPQPVHPSQTVPVGWPTLPALENGQSIRGQGTVLSNLQLRSDSVPTQNLTGEVDKARYLGLVGVNYGSIQNLSLQDTDLVVNLTDSARPADHSAAVTAAEQGRASGATALPRLRGVGALCGLSTGTLTDIRLVKTTGSATARVAAAVTVDDVPSVDAVDEETVAAASGSGLADAVRDIRGVGGLVGIARRAVSGESSAEYRVAGITNGLPVTGVLVEIGKTASAAPDEERYRQAAQGKPQSGLYLPVGIGGVAGYAQQEVLWYSAGGSQPTLAGLENTADVTGNMFSGGVVGCMTGTGEREQLAMQLTNTGLIHASVGYHAQTSRYAGQFFGGIAGYARDSTLWGAANTAGKTQTDTLASLSQTTLQQQCRGDFVGGLIGYANHAGIKTGCETGTGGLVAGNRFVGGFVGGSNGGTLGPDEGTLCNKSCVFGNRYVGGVAGVNGAGSTLRNFLNTGVVGGIPLAGAEGSALTPRCIGGIVGRNDGGWGNGTGVAQINQCGSTVYDKNGTIVSTLTALGANTADFVGGIAGYLDGGTLVSGGQALSTVLVGRNCVGGVAGLIGPTQNALNLWAGDVQGQIYADGDAVGGVAGLCLSADAAGSCRSTVSTTLVSGRYCVGGVFGAYIGPEVSLGGTHTANPLGTVRGQGVVGGLVGYTRAVSTASLADFLEKQAESDEAPGAMAGLLPVMEENTHILRADTGAAIVTDTGAAIRMEGDEAVGNVFAVRGGAYVGGIVGYNEENTRLLLTNCRNTGTIDHYGTALAEGVAVDAYLMANGFAAERTLNDPHARSAFFGGIIGVAGQHTRVDRATNSGTISGGVNGVGGIAGLNEGTITDCALTVNIGNARQNYLGGIVGINACRAKDAPGFDAASVQGTLQNPAGTSGITISGGNRVGGVAGINLPGAAIATADQAIGPIVQAGGENAGGLTGENRGAVTVAGGTSFAGLEVRGTANVGGLVGENTATGTVSGPKAEVSASVSGGTNVGGLVGRNAGRLTGGGGSGDEWLKASGTVTATGNHAGGVVGYQAAGGLAQYAAGMGKVTAQGSHAGCVAGYNAAQATLQNCRAGGTATADNGYAAGVAAQNDGLIDACGDYDDATRRFTLRGFTATANADAIGAAVAVNNGTLQNMTLGTGVYLRGSRTGMVVGGLVGVNNAIVRAGAVSAWLAGVPEEEQNTDAQNKIAMLGGAVGQNNPGGEVAQVAVCADFGGNYPVVGGVAGRNLGKLSGCTYAGTLSGSAGGAGWCLGGIAGQNGNDTDAAVIENCTVERILLSAEGFFSANATLDAPTELENASHIGGIVGRNRRGGTLTGCVTALPGSGTSEITAQYGFLGGVAGSNNGTVTRCGGNGTQTLVDQAAAWLSAKDVNAGRNALVAALTGQDATHLYAALRGADTISDPGAANDLQLNLTARGCVGGVVGFNALSGSITQSASGRWFLYGNGLTMDSAIGGVIGQNESEQNNAGLINCAAVRRFTQSGTGPDTDNTDNTDNTSNATDGSVGGVIGEQQNSTSTGWFLTECVNYGQVFNSRANDMGGVIARWRGNGGTLRNCYNFGNLITNANNDSSDGGCAGGLVGLLNEPGNGGSINILASQNHGSILGVGNYANDCAGILSKVTAQKAGDRLVINIVDCVNGATVKIQANSLACGIFAWLGGDNGTNTQLNIDRCRNFSVHMTTSANGGYYLRRSGIYGTRASATGSGSGKAVTTITNCFTLYNEGAENLDRISPLVFAEAENAHPDWQDGFNNYYMDTASFADTYIAGLKTMTRKTVGPAVSPVTVEADDAADGTEANPAETRLNQNVGGRRLFAGIDNSADATTDGENHYPCFAALPETGVNASALSRATGYITAADDRYQNPAVERAILSHEKVQQATLPLLFGDANGDHTLNLTDVTEETLQHYYTDILDADDPGTPYDVTVRQSSSDTANGCGRYLVAWKSPAGSNAMRYLVNLYPADEMGTRLSETPLKSEFVYASQYTVDAEADWCGKTFVVEITACNATGKTSATVSSGFAADGVAWYDQRIEPAEPRIPAADAGTAYLPGPATPETATPEIATRETATSGAPLRNPTAFVTCAAGKVD